MPAVAAATKMPDPEDKVAQDDMRMREAKRRKEKGRTSTDMAGGGVPVYTNSSLGE
jgi:hypothetical protein